MVSLRCKMIVTTILDQMELQHGEIELGVVTIVGNLDSKQRDKLRRDLAKTGLELIEDKKAILIEKIINVVVTMIHYSVELPTTNYSDYISDKLDYNYTYLSNLFSEVKGITLQHFIIIHKIERVKELILYDELNLTEIADTLHYSSVAHLSNQFKKITGLSPSFFKNLKQKRMGFLENL
ncbi:MAG: helix-turn-helix transcriptional regulator [Saprospiraceae bacterium]